MSHQLLFHHRFREAQSQKVVAPGQAFQDKPPLSDGAPAVRDCSHLGAAVSEGLVVVANGTELGRAKVTITPSEAVPEIPAWVQRMYGELNIAPLDLTTDVSENLGVFRDFQGAKWRKTTPSEVVDEEREFGTVVGFEGDRGYGFILSDKGALTRPLCQFYQLDTWY